MRVNGLVSIIIPIYNYCERLEITLSSIFEQDYKDYEIIIVNDGSTNELVIPLLKKLETNKKIRVIHKENGGPSSARNLGIKNSNGKYILPLDADDTILNGYISRCVNILKSNDKISPVYCDTIHSGEVNFIEERPDWSINRMLRGPFIVSCSMFHISAFYKTKGYDENLTGWEDYDLWLRMMKCGYIGKRIPEPLFNYFRHESDGTVNSKVNPSVMYNQLINKNFIIKDNKILL